MGCCSLRGNRQNLEERSTSNKKAKTYRSDIYMNPTHIFNIRERSEEEMLEKEENGLSDNNMKDEDNFLPIDANNQEERNDDYRSQLSFKDILLKRKSSNTGRNYTYANSKTLHMIENIDNNNPNGDQKLNGAYRKINTIENESDQLNDFKIELKIKLSSMRILNVQIFNALNIDLLNVSFFNSNYCFIALVNLDDFLYYLEAFPTNEMLKLNQSTNNKKDVNEAEKEEINNLKGMESRKDLNNSSYILYTNTNNDYKSKSKSPLRNTHGDFKNDLTEENNSKNIIRSNSIIQDSKENSNSIIKSNKKLESQTNQRSNEDKNSFFEFENPEMYYNLSLNFENSNQFLSIHLFIKHKKIKENSYLVGEAFLPISFLRTKIDISDLIIDIPILTKSDNFTIIAFLNLRLDKKDLLTQEGNNTKEIYVNNKMKSSSNEKTNDHEKKLDMIKTSIDYFSKYQTTKLNNYDSGVLQKLGLLSQVNSLGFTNIKIKFLDLIKKYSIENKKSEALLELNDLLRENPFNQSDDISFENPRNNNNINNSGGNNDLEKYTKKILSKLDFNSISFSKYFAFLSVINEALLDLNERSNLIINSNFIYERVVFNPFTKCDEKFIKEKKFENMVIGDLFFSVIINLKKSYTNPLNNAVRFDSYYNDCIFVFRDLGNFFLNAKSNLLYLVKENGYVNKSNKDTKTIISINLNNIQSNFSNKNVSNLINEDKNSTIKENNILNKGINNIHKIFPILDKKEECFFYMNYNIILKYLNIVNNMLETYNKALKELPESKTVIVKVDNLIENFKNNFDIYLIRKLDEVSLKDLNIATNILTIISSFSKLAHNFSSIRGISRVECYISYLLDEFSPIFNWLQKAFKNFSNSNKFYKCFIELGEQLLGNSPLIFCCNFLQLFSLKQLYFKFSIDAKSIDSRKFPFWITYLNFLNYIISNCQTDACRMTDCYYIETEDFCKHITDLFMIIINYPYFKPISSTYLCWDKKRLMICNKYMENLNDILKRNSKNNSSESVYFKTDVAYIDKNEKNDDNKMESNNLPIQSNEINNNIFKSRSLNNDFSDKFDSFKKREKMGTEFTLETLSPNLNENTFNFLAKNRSNNYLEFTENLNLENLNPSMIAHFQKFLNTNQAIILISKMIDIFAELINRRYIFNLMKNKYKSSLDKFFDLIIFLTLYNNKKDQSLTNETKIIYFSLFSKIIKIIFNLNETLKIDLNVLTKRSLRNIFKINSNSNKKSEIKVNDSELEFDSLPKDILLNILNEKIKFFKNLESIQKNKNPDRIKKDKTETLNKNYDLLEKKINKMKTIQEFN